jgi:hypothetical protein
MRTHCSPPAFARIGWRLLLGLSLLTWLGPATTPLAHADSGCGFQQTYGPYGATVGGQTPELVLALTTCRPDETYRTIVLPWPLPSQTIDNRSRIDWGDGTGWHPENVRSGDCTAALAYCLLYAGPHTYNTPGTYTVHVKYYALRWYTSPAITLQVYDAAPHSSVDTSNWMGAMQDRIRNLKLNTLTIPGTHDSGAFGFNQHSLTSPDFPVNVGTSFQTFANSVENDTSACPAVLVLECKPILQTFAGDVAALGNAYATGPGKDLSSLPSTLAPALAQYTADQSNAQDRTISQQLDDGVRYLDLRLCAPAGSLREITVCHSLYSVGMTQVLNQIHAFVVAHPNEIVIVDLGAFYAAPGGDSTSQINALITQIRTLFSKNPADKCTDPSTCLLVPTGFTPDSTLDSIWKTPGRVIFLENDSQLAMSRLDGYTNPVFWPRDQVHGGEWIRTDDPTDYQKYVLKDLQCRCESYTQATNGTPTTTPDMFFGIGADMSPSDDWVASTLVQRLLQKESNMLTLPAVMMSSLLNHKNRPDLVVDPVTSANAVLRERAKMSNPLVLNAVYASALANPGLAGNANILTTDWYDQSRLVDIAIALNQARGSSATLYSSVNYSGASRGFLDDVPDFVRIGFNDQVSSLAVSSGAVVTLFSDAYYQGTCQAFTDSDPDLRGSTIGNDTASSMRIDSRSYCGVPWLTLFQDANLGGSSFTATASVPTLNGHVVGYHQASSLVVGPGTTVSAYSQPNYTGACQTFTAGVTPDLAKASIGNDAIGSIKLGEACPAAVVSGDVTLCANENFVPPCVYLHNDVPKFSATSLGDDAIRSLGVFAGDTIALFSEENYRGMCVPFTGGTYPELRTAGMSARASSMLVARGCPSSPDYPGVTLFDGITFTGASAFVTGDVADLAASGLNDRVSSLALSPGLVVSLYTDANFKGSCVAFNANAADLRSTPFPNDSASSLRLSTSSTCPN